LANEYAKRNGEELLNDAAETVERWRSEGFFGKRAQSCFVQDLRLTHSAPRPEPQAVAASTVRHNREIAD